MKNGHEQENDGVPLGYDRVTDILSPYKSFEGVDRTVLASACERGKQVHNFCELYALNLLIESPSDIVKPYFESFVKWFDTWVDDVIEVEQRINDPELKISGKFDLLCKLKHSDKLVIVDYKTPLLFDRTWSLQMTAYKMLLERNTKYQADRCVCLKLDSDGRDPVTEEYKDFSQLSYLLLNQIQIYRFFNRKVNAKRLD